MKKYALSFFAVYAFVAGALLLVRYFTYGLGMLLLGWFFWLLGLVLPFHVVRALADGADWLLGMVSFIFGLRQWDKDSLVLLGHVWYGLNFVSALAGARFAGREFFREHARPPSPHEVKRWVRYALLGVVLFFAGLAAYVISIIRADVVIDFLLNVKYMGLLLAYLTCVLLVYHQGMQWMFMRSAKHKNHVQKLAHSQRH